ncbi:5-methyltetrahydropteroyltriglutamate-- homocysteine methyltransferase [Streptococcus pneumoniae]|nr:5-methyltetrahydropteroyltriglutamate-- homocysteine methyltransferase [Streptococcus pneumoniae]
MSTTIIGFPRLGEFRELKFTTEKYFRKEISEEELLAAAKDLRAKHWNIVKEKVSLKFHQMTFLTMITS